MEYYKPTYFKTQEFVDKATYEKRGEQSLQLIDVRMLWTMDEIRKYFNKSITINNWHTGKNRQWSGLRTSTSTEYSVYSQHSFGRAIDFLVTGMNPADVRRVIKENANKEPFQYITAIEDFPNMSWIHIDCRTWDKAKNGLLIFTQP